MASTSEPIHIVRLDAIYLPDPTFSSSLDHTYESHQLTSPDQTKDRLAKATIAITTTVRITREILASCPSLKMIAVMAIGTDIVDLEACREREVLVCNVPAASNESVAEHAIALYFSLRRRIVPLHELTAAGEEWKKKGALKDEYGVELPGTCKEEVCGIFGGGELGKRVANIAKALGMKILFADRRDASPSSIREGRTSFEEVTKASTVIMITCPLSPSTRNLISFPELSCMRPEAIIINVARGGIVDEEAIVKALREGRIAGMAADVFSAEPATKENSELVKAAKEQGMEGKLVLTPHVAWCAQSSIEKLRGTVMANIEGWVAGKPINVVV